MLGKDRIHALGGLIRVLRRVKEVPFGPEGLNTTHDDAGPNLAGSLYESNGSDVIEVRRVKDFR